MVAKKMFQEFVDNEIEKKVQLILEKMLLQKIVMVKLVMFVFFITIQ